MILAVNVAVRYFSIFDKNIAKIWTILEKCKIGNVKIVMLQWNILQYLTKVLRKYFNCNERLEIFLTCFCNILCYVWCIILTLIGPDNQTFQSPWVLYTLFDSAHFYIYISFIHACVATLCPLQKRYDMKRYVINLIS